MMTSKIRKKIGVTLLLAKAHRGEAKTHSVEEAQRGVTAKYPKPFHHSDHRLRCSQLITGNPYISQLSSYPHHIQAYNQQVPNPELSPRRTWTGRLLPVHVPEVPDRRSRVPTCACRHALRVMKYGELGFTGASIANRWPGSTKKGTKARLAAKPAVVATAGVGVPGELPAAPAAPSVFTHSKATVRANGWASCSALGKELANITAGIDNIPGISRVMENLKNHARLMVGVKLRSQNDRSTSRVLKGVVTKPTIATEVSVDTRSGGRSGRGKRGGAGRGRANGRGRR